MIYSYKCRLHNKVEKYSLLHKLNLGLSMIGGMGEDAAPTWERWRTFVDSLEGIPKKKFVPSAARANQYDANGAGFIPTFVKVILWLRVHGFSVIWWTDWWVKHHFSILANVPLAETQLSKRRKKAAARLFHLKCILVHININRTKTLTVKIHKTVSPYKFSRTPIFYFVHIVVRHFKKRSAGNRKWAVSSPLLLKR